MSFHRRSDQEMLFTPFQRRYSLVQLPAGFVSLNLRLRIVGLLQRPYLSSENNTVCVFYRTPHKILISRYHSASYTSEVSASTPHNTAQHLTTDFSLYFTLFVRILHFPYTIHRKTEFLRATMRVRCCEVLVRCLANTALHLIYYYTAH